MPLSPMSALRREIAAGQVMLVVGTGVSIHATKGARAASWPGLLSMGITYCAQWVNPKPAAAWIEAQQSLLNKPTLDNFLSVATEIETCLDAPLGSRFQHFLETTAGDLHPARYEMTDGIKALQNAGALIATTNYDSVLEETTKLDAVPWDDPFAAERLVRARSPGILHLHGWWRKSASIILGVGSYKTIRENKHAQAVQQLLALGRTLVFVGCGDGLDDPNFGALLEWMRSAIPASGLHHYRLCRNAEETRLREKHATDQRIVVVPYGETYEDFGRFAAQLSSPPVSAAAQVSPPVAMPQASGARRAIRFEQECIVDENSVRDLIATGSAPAIDWHPSVLRELARLEDWWENFHTRSAVYRRKSHDGGADDHQDFTWQRAKLRSDRDRIRERVNFFPSALRRALDSTSEVEEPLRVAAVKNLASFMALQIIRLVQFGETYLFDEGPRHHASFPGLPEVPGWLVELVPEDSALGAYVFKEEKFLKARVGTEEARYEYIVLPKFAAEYIHRTGEPGSRHIYFEWVLPQWLLYNYDRLPACDQWRVWVLSDGRGRECWSQMFKRPWDEA